MKVTCKCHGVSGSCSLVTCWQQLAPFRKIGDELFEKYNDALRVKITKNGRLRYKPNVKKRQNLAGDLVYLKKSPDYCAPNATYGIHGNCRNILFLLFINTNYPNVFTQALGAVFAKTIQNMTITADHYVVIEDLIEQLYHMKKDVIVNFIGVAGLNAKHVVCEKWLINVNNFLLLDF